MYCKVKTERNFPGIHKDLVWPSVGKQVGEEPLSGPFPINYHLASQAGPGPQPTNRDASPKRLMTGSAGAFQNPALVRFSLSWSMAVPYCWLNALGNQLAVKDRICKGPMASAFMTCCKNRKKTDEMECRWPSSPWGEMRQQIYNKGQASVSG